MDKTEMIACASCGARISSNAEQCGACGWPVGQRDHDMTSNTKDADAQVAAPASSPAETSESGPFCHMCGWENPTGARFCSACGTQLQDVSQQPDTPSPAEKEIPQGTKAIKPEAVEQGALASQDEEEKPVPINSFHIGMLVVAGILVVASLYIITSFSRRAFPEEVPAAAQAQSAGEATQSNELSSDVSDRIAAIEAEAASLTGEALVLKKREIVSILSSVNRPDKAAAVQEEIASLTGTRDDWFQVGHFYYDAMEVVGGEGRFGVAQQAATAYETGLEIGPDDLNVRTALAMAYLNTRAPMQGVQQIRQVLDTDPDHLQGNFYYGVMLSQINRTEQAKEQFERVKQLVGPDSPIYQQADRMLQNLGSL